MSAMLDLLLTRRSVSANELVEPGPSPEQVGMILKAAHRVPDHGKIGPWRYVLFSGNARADFSHKLGEIFAEKNPDATDKLLEFESTRLTRAPLVIAVISSPDINHPKIPEWEQILSAGATCQNILLAITALGFGAQWVTEWYSYDEDVGDLLKLKADERVAGFIYIGSVKEKPEERPRPDLGERVWYW